MRLRCILRVRYTCIVKVESEATKVDTQTFVPEALEWLRGEDELFGESGVLPACIQEGSGRLIVVTGDNASGKSLLGNYISAIHKHVTSENDVRADRWIVGMSSRAGEGFHRTFMYGDESVSSTGDISIKAVSGSFRTSRGRDIRHLVVLDEPDTGLSEEFAAAMGAYIAEFGADMPHLCDALVVVTHSRALARQLLALRPHHVRMGDALSLEDWASSAPQIRSIEALLAVQENALDRFRAVSAILKERQRK